MAKQGKNLDDLQDINRAVIIRYLTQNEGCSRAELAKITGLKQASITKIIKSLMNGGVVREIGFVEGEKGRRSIGLALNHARYMVIGVKLSWQRLKINVYDLMGHSHGEMISIPLEGLSRENADTVLEMIVDGVSRLSREFPEVAAVGFAVPGPYKIKEGDILMPKDQQDRHRHFYYPIKKKLVERIALPVFIEHDADAGALGYWWFHSNCNTKITILHVLASEGIGGGVVEGGKIFGIGRGHAPEIGHVSIRHDGILCECGNRGCLEMYCSFRSIVRIAMQHASDYPDSLLWKHDNISVQTFFAALESGDALARDLVRHAGRNLAFGLISLHALFTPNIIVISDILAMAGDELREAIAQAFEEQFPVYYDYAKPEIELIKPSEDLVLLGAATVAIDQILSHPTEYLIHDAG